MLEISCLTEYHQAWHKFEPLSSWNLLTSLLKFETQTWGSLRLCWILVFSLLQCSIPGTSWRGSGIKFNNPSIHSPHSQDIYCRAEYSFTGLPSYTLYGLVRQGAAATGTKINNIPASWLPWASWPFSLPLSLIPFVYHLPCCSFLCINCCNENPASP